MSERLPSAILVGALLRRVNDAGGMGMVLAKGDPQAGTILIVACEKGHDYKLLEAGFGINGMRQMVRAGPQVLEDTAEIEAYWRRRRDGDPDLWVLELDIAEAERFAAETIIAA